jgi:tape measure domain-containing protein
MQKSFRIGGSSPQEQSSGMYQLTQAMAAGKLQGDEFRSIMENAPMLADAIAKYTGKSKGELKEMSAEGTITANIIKSALFAAGDDINAKFAKMPYTFADIGNKIKNNFSNSFDKVKQKINSLVNTDKFLVFVNKLSIGFDIAANGAAWLISAIVNGWDTIGPILAIIAGVYLITMIAQLWAMVPPLIAQAMAWLAIYWPILLVIGIIALAITAARQFGASWEEIAGVVGGVIGVLVACIYNGFVQVWNFIAEFVNFFGNVFRDPASAVDVLFLNLANNILGYIRTIAKGIQDLFSSMGVNIDITSGIDSLMNKISQASADIKLKSGYKTYVEQKNYMDYSEGYTKGSNTGKNLVGDISSGLKELTDSMTGTEMDPTVVKGTGSSGGLKVDMSEEDLTYLRDLAERDYINKFSSATLAPNITVNFGDVHEEADANKVAGRVKRILQEEIAMTAEGDY